MPRFSYAQTSFNAGELAPEVQGRRDLANYAAGAETVENFIVTPEGGLHRRPGTRYAGDSASTNNASRLIPFVDADGSSFILEFSDLSIHIWKGTSQIQHSAKTLDYTSSGTNITTNEFEYEDHGFYHGDGPFELTGAGIPTGASASTEYYIMLPETAQGDQSAIDTGTEKLTATGTPRWEDEMGPYRFETDGELPGGLDSFTDYYLLNTTSSTTELSTTPGGSAVNITSKGSGTWTLRPTQSYMRNKFRLTTSGLGFPQVDLTVIGTGSGTIIPYDSGTVDVRIRTDYLQTNIANLQFAQSANALYIAHPNFRPAQLTRVDDEQWRWDYIAFVDGPYYDENTDESATITTTSHSLASRTTLTLNSDAQALINDGAGWQASTDIGRIVRLANAASASGYVEIDSVQSATVAEGTVLQAIGSTAGALWRWRLGAWHAGSGSSSNYPRAVAVAEQRLCFAGEKETPNFVTASNTGAFNVFRPNDPESAANDPTVRSTDTVRVGVYDNRSQRIKWLAVNRTLLAGSDSSVFVIRGSLDGEAFSPTNINAVKVSAIGCDTTQPVSVSQHTVYVTRNAQGMRGLESDTAAGSSAEQVPIDLAMLARHIFARTESIVDMDHQQDRRSILWAVRSDGVLLGCTYVPEQGVFAWHTHKLGGTSGNSDYGLVQSVAVDSSTGGSFDRVWLCVKRSDMDNGFQIEFFEDEWLDGDQTSQTFLDCHSEPYSGSATTTQTGHTQYETDAFPLQALGDGAVIPDIEESAFNLSTGTVTTSESYSDFVMGFGYTSTFRSLPYPLPDRAGDSHGKMGRFDHVILRLWQSHTGEIGVVDWDGTVPLWSNIVQRGAGSVLGSPVSAFTGDVKVALDGGFERRHQIEIRQTQPVAFNLLAVTLHGNVGAR